MSTLSPGESAPREEALLSAVRQHMQDGDMEAVAALLSGVPAADVAALLGELDEEQQAPAFRLLDADTRAEVLGELDEDVVRSLAETAPVRLQEAVGRMEPDEMVDVVDMLPADQADALLEKLPEEQAAVAEQLRTYEPDSAGGLMTTEFVQLGREMTAREAIQVTQRSREAETVAHLFVADADGMLVGTLPLAELVFARPETRVGDLMEELPSVATVETDQEDLVRAATRYNLDVIPVVDAQQHLAGVVTVDDILEAAEEEADEDMFRLAGTDERDPVRASVYHSTRRRLPWLMLSVFDGLFIAFVVSRFSTTLQMTHELSFFIPLIPLMGGQVAIQSSTIMVRAMAVGDIRRGMLLGYMSKQMVINLLLAVCCAAAVGVLGRLLVGAPVDVMSAVGLAVGIAIMFAGTFGMIFPLVFDYVGIDPAVSSGPFITMLNDLFCISIYLVLGMLLAPAA